MKKYLIIFFLMNLFFLPLKSQVMNISDNHSDSINPFIFIRNDIRYIFWNDNEDGDFDIFFKYHEKGSWTETIKISTPNDAHLSFVNVVDSQLFYMLWIEKKDKHNRLVYGKIADFILIDSTEIFSSDSTIIQFCSSLFDTSTQELHISFDVHTGDSVLTYYTMCSGDNTWSDSKIILKNGNRAQLIKDKNNDILCLWFNQASDTMSVNMLIKQSSGEWVPGVKLSNGFEGVGLNFIAKSDDSLNVYTASNGQLLTCPCNVLYYSKWDGVDWSPVEYVPAENKYYQNNEHIFPDISFTMDNFPVITWEQRGYNDLLLADVFIGKSVKTNSGWDFTSSIIRGGNSRPEKPRIVVDSDDFINYVWQNYLDSDYDIYYFKTNVLAAIERKTTQFNPIDFELNQNYPNPFNPQTNIGFYLPQSEDVEIAIYDILGRKVKTLLSGRIGSGSHTTIWNGTNDSGLLCASGIYYYRLRAGEFVEMKKMLLVE